MMLHLERSGILEMTLAEQPNHAGTGVVGRMSIVGWMQDRNGLRHRAGRGISP
jgi:hypothetical protein